jgi:hypothetical protein
VSFTVGGKRASRLALVIVIAILLGVAALVAGAGVLSAASPTMPLSALSAAPGAQSNPHDPVQTVRFTLYAEGIYPRETHVDKGRVVVSLTDYTGGSDGLVVEREAPGGGKPERAGKVERSGAHWRGRQEIHLTPGHYKVYDASRPENAAALIVEP